MRRAPTTAFALIDWHNVQRYFAPAFHTNPLRELRPAITHIQSALVTTLRHLGHSAGYRVTMRIYHGWHTGRERTQARRAFDDFARDASLARRIGAVSFAPGFQFGNELACPTDRGPLFDTARSGGQ